MAPQLFTARILWGALLVSSLLYGVVLGILPPRVAAVSPQMAPTLGAVALMLAALSFVLPRQIRRSALSRVELAVTSEADSGDVASFYRDQAPTRKVITDKAAAYKAAAPSYLTSLILSLALSEAISLLGFVLGFLGSGPFVWVPFMAVGSTLIVIRFPTPRRMVGPLEEALGAKIADDEGR